MITTVSGTKLSEIGIGSYGIGGRGHRDMPLTEKQRDEIYIDAVALSIDAGANFTEIALGYGHGNSLRLFKLGLDRSKLSREDVFITHSLYPRDLKDFSDISSDTQKFHDVMETDYADSTLVTQSLILKFGEQAVYEWLHQLLRTNKTRYVSLSNASPSWIHKFKDEFSESFVAHEGHISFEVRSLQDKGVLSACEELGVLNIIWRPLRRKASLVNNYPLLKEFSEKYGKSSSQIILNWMIHFGYRPMVFSTNKTHINENMQSNEFKMENADYDRMSNYRLKTVNLPSIDWEGPSIDDDIVGLVSNIDEYVVD